MRTRFVGNLPEELVEEVVASHRKILTEAGFYSELDIRLYCLAILDCKVVDIEDSIEPELFNKVMKAAGYRQQSLLFIIASAATGPHWDELQVCGYPQSIYN